MKSIQRLANEYIDWATDQFNQDRQMLAAELRLSRFSTRRNLSSATHTAIYWNLINRGVL